jgi:hypothetical protein
MQISKYLVITPSAMKYSSKASVKLIEKLGKTYIPSNAVVLKLNLDLPDALFKKPQLEATLKVSADQVSRPIIEPEVLQNIQQVLNQQLGIDLQINVVQDEKVKKGK